MNLDVPLELYKIFCSVVRTGNMSAAAKELYISQPAVSMSIRQLENKLGSPLLIRTSKGAVPTPEGKMLYGYLEEALGLIDTAEKKYLEMVNLEAGEMRIGASDTLISHFLLPYLEQFTTQNKKISIKVTNKTTGETLKLLKSGKVDIGFINLPIEDEENYDIIECKKIHEVLVCGKKWAHLAKEGLQLKEIERYPLLLLEKLSNTRKFIDTYALENGVVLDPIIELGSIELLIQFARINMGFTFITKEFADSELNSETIFEVPLTPPVPERHIGLVKLKSVKLSNAAKSFVEMF